MCLDQEKHYFWTIKDFLYFVYSYEVNPQVLKSSPCAPCTTNCLYMFSAPVAYCLVLVNILSHTNQRSKIETTVKLPNFSFPTLLDPKKHGFLKEAWFCIFIFCHTLTYTVHTHTRTHYQLKCFKVEVIIQEHY